MRTKLILLAIVLNTSAALISAAISRYANRDLSRIAPLPAPPPAADVNPRGGEVSGVDIPLEDVNQSDFIQPFNMPLSRDQIEEIMETPGIKLIRRGGRNTPSSKDVVGVFFPEETDMFGVHIKLEAGHEPGEEKLAEAAERQFLLAEPENPGRDRSFPKWQTVPQPGRAPVPLIRTGWWMVIRSVKPIPGGWRARVHVHPQVRADGYAAVSVRNFHIEVYTYKDGELGLESEALDPDPLISPDDGGLTCNFH